VISIFKFFRDSFANAAFKPPLPFAAPTINFGLPALQNKPGKPSYAEAQMGVERGH
jgi:hypothetical protein